MPIRVHIGGSVCPPEEAKVSVFDRGFLYGDSVYETIGTAYGRLFAARDHLYRLERSAERIGLRAPRGPPSSPPAPPFTAWRPRGRGSPGGPRPGPPSSAPSPRPWRRRAS